MIKTASDDCGSVLCDVQTDVMVSRGDRACLDDVDPSDLSWPPPIEVEDAVKECDPELISPLDDSQEDHGPSPQQGLTSLALPASLKTRLVRLRSEEDLYPSAIEIVIRQGRGSVSLLQRALGIGYGRAARMIDFMADDGIVGGFRKTGIPRDVLYTWEAWVASRNSKPSKIHEGQSNVEPTAQTAEWRAV